jgi:hypothetical protein
MILQQWAARKSSSFTVMQRGNLENELNVQLDGVWRHQQRTVQIIAARAAVSVTDQAQAAAAAVEELQRKLELERLREQMELQKLRYLREEVFSRPDVARSYWLHHHPDSLSDLLTDRFEQIAAKFGESGETSFIVVARLVEDFLGKLDEDGRAYLVKQLDRVFASFNRPDLSEQLAGAEYPTPDE